MDIEELTKTQIILLVLLVTFVTSIATGIVTVSLLAQAPPAVTQTVNHIIQRTVEAVSPETEQPTTVKETTVIVKEDELVTSSIAASFSKVGVVREGVASTSPAAALGFVIPGGLLLTDASVADGEHAVSFEATTTVYILKSKLPEVGIAVLEPKSASGPAFKVGDAAAIKLGQTVIAIPSASGTRVGIGAVSARYTLARISDEATETPIRAIETNISSKITVGAPLVNAFGDVIGISTSVSQGPSGSAGTFVAMSDLVPLVSGVRGTSTPALPSAAPAL